MDNKPMEKEALSAIQQAVSMFGFSYADPNFDENGGDFFIIEEVDDGNIKAIRCQSKGRNITGSNSHVSIPAKYVTDYFVVFVYLRVDTLKQVFMFTRKDIEQWNLKNGVYSKTFAKSYLLNENEHVFDKSKIPVLRALLDEISISVAVETFDALKTISAFYTLWKMSGSMPDIDALNYWQEQYDGGYITFSELFFFLCALANANPDDTSYSLDAYFIDLKGINNICQVESQAIIIGVPKHLNSCLAYNRSFIAPISYKKNNLEEIKGWHLQFGDYEEHFKIEIFRDGRYNFEYVC